MTSSPSFSWQPGDAFRCEFCRDLLREAASFFGLVLLDEQGHAICRARSNYDPAAPSQQHRPISRRQPGAPS